MKRLILLSLTVAALALPASAFAVATMIDFNAAVGPYSSWAEADAVITLNSGGTNILGALTPNGTGGLVDGDSPRDYFRADITADIYAVCVDLGDFGADGDLLFLNIYNSSNALLGSSTLFIPEYFSGMKTLSAASNQHIAYATFGGIGVNGSSVFIDNFKYDTVPEPASLLLIGTGAMALAARRRRRSASC